MPDIELTARIKADIADFQNKIKKLESTLAEANEEMGKGTEEAAKFAMAACVAFAKTGGDLSSTQKEVTNSVLENGKAIKENIRDYRIANIETMQYNQTLQMMGNTATAWGTKMQGGSSIVTKGMQDLRDGMDKATGGMISVFGAGVQLLGQGVEVYAQVQRIAIMWGAHAAATAAASTAQAENTVATAASIPVHAGLNAVLWANPIVLVAAGIVGLTLAIGAGMVALSNYRNAQAETARKIQETIDKLDIAKTKMREMITGEKEPKDLLSQRQNIQDDIALLEEKRAAAIEAGLTDRAEGYRSQIEARQEELAELEIRIKKAQERYTPDMPDLAKAAESVRKAAEEAYKAAHPLGAMPDENARIQKAMKNSGESAIKSYLEGMLEAATNEQTRSVITKVADSLGITLEAHSPPKVGPLKDIERWGANLISGYAEGMNTGARESKAIVSSAAGGMAAPIQSGNASYNNGDYRSYNNAPNISIQMTALDYDNPEFQKKIAMVVSRELTRLMVVS